MNLKINTCVIVLCLHDYFASEMRGNRLSEKNDWANMAKKWIEIEDDTDIIQSKVEEVATPWHLLWDLNLLPLLFLLLLARL